MTSLGKSFPYSFYIAYFQFRSRKIAFSSLNTNTTELLYALKHILAIVLQNMYKNSISMSGSV